VLEHEQPCRPKGRQRTPGLRHAPLWNNHATSQAHGYFLTLTVPKKKIGAHLGEATGQRCVPFAVWAPNAGQVAVDFNVPLNKQGRSPGSLPGGSSSLTFPAVFRSAQTRTGDGGTGSVRPLACITVALQLHVTEHAWPETVATAARQRFARTTNETRCNHAHGFRGRASDPEPL